MKGDVRCISIDNLPINVVVPKSRMNHSRSRCKSVPNPSLSARQQGSLARKTRWPVASYYYSTSSFPSLYTTLTTNEAKKEESEKSTQRNEKGIVVRGCPAATEIGGNKERFPWKQCSGRSFTSVKVLTPRHSKDCAQPKHCESNTDQDRLENKGETIPPSGHVSANSESMPGNREEEVSLRSHSPIAIQAWPQRKIYLSTQPHMTQSLTSYTEQRNYNTSTTINDLKTARSSTQQTKRVHKPLTHRLSFAKSYTNQISAINCHNSDRGYRIPVSHRRHVIKEPVNGTDTQVTTIPAHISDLNKSSTKVSGQDNNSTSNQLHTSLPSKQNIGGKFSYLRFNKPPINSLAHSAANYRDPATSKASLLSTEQLVIRESVEKVQRWMRTLPKHFHTIHHVLPPVQYDY
nr:uncharacterized protein LOC100177526 [Ciona intestinalis]|eukprot:XP_002119848.1 uncharacterized protein LOC100177526 [Ciona intestinalis]